MIDIIDLTHEIGVGRRFIEAVVEPDDVAKRQPETGSIWLTWPGAHRIAALFVGRGGLPLTKGLPTVSTTDAPKETPEAPKETPARELYQQALVELAQLAGWSDEQLEEVRIDLEELGVNIHTMVDAEVIILSEDEEPSSLASFEIRTREVSVGGGTDQDITEQDLGPVINPGGEM